MWIARCDSAMTTTPEIPHGANLWNTVSTIVAPATRAALTSVFSTHSMSSRCLVSHSYKSSTTCEPSTARRADSFSGAESAACRVMSVASAPISNRLEPSPESLPLALSTIRLPFLPLLVLLFFLLLARRSPRLYAFHRSRDLGQTLIGQSIQRRKSGAQQLALFDGNPQP